jgi:hypothetical protein
METECASCEVRTGLWVLLQVASISQLTVSLGHCVFRFILWGNCVRPVANAIRVCFAHSFHFSVMYNSLIHFPRSWFIAPLLQLPNSPYSSFTVWRIMPSHYDTAMWCVIISLQFRSVRLFNIFQTRSIIIQINFAPTKTLRGDLL